MISRLLANLLVYRRGWIAVVLVVVTLVALAGASQLQFDDRPHNVFKADNPQYQLLTEVNRDFGSDDNDCFLLVSAPDLFTPAAIAGLREVVRETRQVAGIDSVSSLADVVVIRPGLLPTPVKLLPAADADADEFAAARERAMRHPLVAGHLLSEDGNTALVIARIAGDRSTIRALDPVVHELQQRVQNAAARHGLEVQLTGIPPLRVEIFNSVRGENSKFTVIGAVLAFLTSLVLFRRLRLVFIASTGPLLAAVWTLGLMGLLGVKVNIINVVLPTLVIVVGLTNAIHIIGEIRRERARGLSALDASGVAVRHLGFACALAALTTAVGFGSLVASQAEIVRNFGIVCAMGAMLRFSQSSSPRRCWPDG